MSLLRPYWIPITVTIPLCIVVLYFGNIYTLLESELQKRNLDYWLLYGLMLGALITAATVYGAIRLRQRKAVDWIYAALMLVGCMVFVFFYLNGASRLLPWSVDEWVVSSDDVYILPLSMIMPAIMHALMILVVEFTPNDNKKVIFKTVAATIAVPAIWYMSLRLLFPLIRGELGWSLRNHIQMVLFIMLAVAFMYLVMRLAYLIVNKVRNSGLRSGILMTLLITVVVPMLSLLVYNGEIEVFDAGILAELQFVGDWSHPVYYAMVVFNGMLLSLPTSQQQILGLVSFSARTLLYPVVFYFFIVFLPFFPLAVSSVVLFGLGFLLLAPLLLFFIQTRILHADWEVLCRRYGTILPSVLFIVVFLIVPLGVTVSYYLDRSTLSSMLEHVYEADYSKASAENIDIEAAARVLTHIRTVKRGGDIFTGERKPYLTNYYQWLVLDRLTLSNSRLSVLESIFLGLPVSESRRERVNSPRGPVVTLADSVTKLSEDGSYYVSTIDLEITNPDSELSNSEFATRFTLPPGGWVRNYYLMIEGERVEGILSEKKSAMWVYKQARDSRKDPGLLYYTSPDEMILRVFPFAAGEVRRTGFEVIHREPIAFVIDGKQLELNPDKQDRVQIGDSSVDEGFFLVTAAEKERLPRYTRKPYLHFIVDRSASASHLYSDYRERIELLMKKNALYGVGFDGAQVTFANYEDLTVPLVTGWQEESDGFDAVGGFFLERAVKRVLLQNYRQHSDHYPLFVIVADDIEQAAFPAGMQEFMITMPEGDEFVLMDSHGRKSIRRLSSPKIESDTTLSFNPLSRPVVAWSRGDKPEAFLPLNGRAGMVILDIDTVNKALDLGGDAWSNGLSAYGLWLSSRLNPVNGGEKSYAVIMNSFRTQLLMPLTAFLSPESDVQRQILLRKQQRVLSSMRPLDIGEEHEMDEPPLWLLMLMAPLFWLLRQRVKKTSLANSCAA